VREEADLRAIERLHQKDMQASRAGDFETLRSIMTDEAVILPPGG
jgi:ketosteroid isomerase-like protein